MTGRGAGYCAGFNMPGFMNPVPGRGFGFGRGGGRGRGWRHRHYATGLPGWGRMGWSPDYDAAPYYGPPAPEQETQALQAQAENLEKALTEIKNRITELEAAQAKES